MRILMVAANYPPRTGGPASSVPVISRKLMERGHDVLILTASAPGPHRSKTPEGEVYRAYELGSDYFSYPAISSRVASMIPISQYLIRMQKIDLVHVHDLTVSAVAALFGRAFTKIPSIGKHTGDMVYEFAGLRTKQPPTSMEAIWNKNLLNKSLFRFQKYVLNKYDLIHSPSQYKKRFIEDLGIPSEKIRVIPNGIEMHTIAHESDGKTILTAARLVPWKGIDTLIRAIQHVKKEIPDVNLKIVGEGPEKTSLRELAKGMHLTKNVTFLGSVPHEEVYALMAGADVYALPSLYDPAPHAPLEALSVGTPVVASDVGGIPEVVKDKKNGLLVGPNDPKELAGAILKVLKSPRMRDDMGKEGMKTAKRYEWDKIVDKIEDAYGELVGD